MVLSRVPILSLVLLVWNADAFSSSSTAVCNPRLQGRLHKRDVCSALLSVTATHRRGLLRGVVDTDVDSSRFYADTIDTSREGLAWLDESGLMWEAAVEDANEKGVPVEEYMANIKANTRKFALSDTIFDRKELLGALRDAFNDEGQFVLLLGGKSVGKSYVLETLRNQYNSASANAFAKRETKRLVLYVDGRSTGLKLQVGLMSEIAKLSLWGVVSQPVGKYWANALMKAGKGVSEGFFEAMTEKTGNATSSRIKKALQPIIDALFRNLTTAELQLELLQNFVDLAKRKNAYPVVIIDEANVVLGRGGNETEIILRDFVARTKQKKELSLILTSSEHGYPYQLELEGLNLQDVTEVIFAGEIPPRDMWKLLVNATYEQGNNKGDTIIGMGPRLAELCLAAYGGHFLRVKNAVAKLCRQESRFKASSLLPVLRANIIECLDSGMSSRPLLEAMAKSGFAPIETYKNAAVETIAKLNIGGVVNEETTICGLWETKWDGTECTYGLIPSAQSVRLAIARTLNAKPAVKVENTTIPAVEVEKTTIPARGRFWRLHSFFRKFRI
jgi:hypothetical protein